MVIVAINLGVLIIIDSISFNLYNLKPKIWLQKTNINKNNIFLFWDEYPRSQILITNSHQH